MIQAPLGDAELSSRIEALEPDGITIFTLGGGRVRGALLHGTRMVNAMRANHGLGPAETLLLGRAYLFAALLGTTIKGEDRLVLRVDGNGPAEGFSVETTAGSEVRGWLFKNPVGELGESSPFGSGTLTVTRFTEGKAHPFVGSVELETGRLAQDLAAYYLKSEQTRTAFDAGIELDASRRAVGAGALYLQALPGADEDFLGRVEDAIPFLPPIGKYFAEGGSAGAFLEANLAPLFPEIVGERGASFSCRCSRERFGSFLAASSLELLKDLAEKGPWPIETVCHNCGSAYHFPKDEIEAMLAAKKPRG
jgi:Disulfide bond chaperones of the HSP33 family